MREWPQRTQRKARIEIIPMIDVMMFLLVFFVLISLNVLPALGLHVHLPGSKAPERVTPPRRATISLGEHGEIDLDGAAIGLDALGTRLSALHAASPDLQVLIAGDKETELQRLVDVLDALKQAGVPAAAIITKQE